MKKIFFSIAIFSLVLFLSACGKEKSAPVIENDKQSQAVLSDTLDVSREYLYLHYQTEMVLTQPGAYADFETWSAEMTDIVARWQGLEQKAAALEAGAEKYARLEKDWWQTPYASAITTAEINNIFDKAPAGQKIKTLAKHLGVDAKRAALILKQAQDETEAEAWNEAGDTFQKLETSAVLIKNGCKVAGFVGGVIISGGTAGLAAATTATKAAVVVSGADLVLEVSEDSAKIALGNNNKVSEFIGELRQVTEPLGTILSITSVPDNLASGFDKFNAVMLALDQFRSAAQEGKVVGIALPTYDPEKPGPILGGAMSEAEIEEWLKGLGVKRTDGDYAELMQKIGETLAAKAAPAETAPKPDEPMAEEANVGDESSEPEASAPVSETPGTGGTSAGPAPVYGKDGKVRAVFTGPAEDTFSPRQARMWEVEVSGFDNQGGLASYECDFVFYLNGNRYQEMLANRGCAFTSTFIEQAGSLRAEVSLKLMKNRAVYNDDGSFKEVVKDVYETIVLQREFVVAK